jgi:hypothetical protein
MPNRKFRQADKTAVAVLRHPLLLVLIRKLTQTSLPKSCAEQTFSSSFSFAGCSRRASTAAAQEKA